LRHWRRKIEPQFSGIEIEIALQKVSGPFIEQGDSEMGELPSNGSLGTAAFELV
jgi:hypothetical protein